MTAKRDRLALRASVEFEILTILEEHRPDHAADDHARMLQARLDIVIAAQKRRWKRAYQAAKVP